MGRPKGSKNKKGNGHKRAYVHSAAWIAKHKHISAHKSIGVHKYAKKGKKGAYTHSAAYLEKHSTNKSTVKVFKGKRGRVGRPRKVEVIDTPIITRSARFMGFCPKCEVSICSLDMTGVHMFNCPSCDYHGNSKELKDKRDIDKPASKKEYMQTVHATSIHEFYGTPPAAPSPVHEVPVKTEDPGDSEVLEDNTPADVPEGT